MTNRGCLIGPHSRSYKLFGIPQNLGEFADKIKKKGEKNVNFVLSSYTEVSPVIYYISSPDPMNAYLQFAENIFIPDSERYKSMIVVQAGKYSFDLHQSDHNMVPGTPRVKLNLLSSILGDANFFQEMGFDVKVNGQSVDKMKAIYKEYWVLYNQYERVVGL